MGMAQRRKGRKGQQEAMALLRERDWSVAELNGGTEVEDGIVTDTEGRTWSLEVKMQKSISVSHRQQAMRQAHKRRLPWMLMCHIEGSRSWLVQRQGSKPAVWDSFESTGPESQSSSN